MQLELNLDYNPCYNYCMEKGEKEFNEFMQSGNVITHYYEWLEKAEKIEELF